MSISRRGAIAALLSVPAAAAFSQNSSTAMRVVLTIPDDFELVVNLSYGPLTLSGKDIREALTGVSE